MRADVPAYTDDGLPPAARYRLEVERRIVQGLLPASRLDRVTAADVAHHRKQYRARVASRTYRDAPECGCGQRCGYIRPNAEKRITVPDDLAHPTMRAPASDKRPDFLHTLDPYQL
jgi:hypothetical protein